MFSRRLYKKLNLQNVSNVCLILCSILVAGFVITSWLDRFPSRIDPRVEALGGRPAVKLDTISGHISGNAAVVFVLSSNCVHCENGGSKLRDIAARLESEHSNVDRLALFSIGEDSKSFLSKHAISAKGLNANLTNLGLAAYPQILLLKPDGTITKKYLGLNTLDFAEMQRSLMEISKMGEN